MKILCCLCLIGIPDCYDLLGLEVYLHLCFTRESSCVECAGSRGQPEVEGDNSAIYRRPDASCFGAPQDAHHKGSLSAVCRSFKGASTSLLTSFVSVSPSAW
jgi:hypothetical protein